MDCTYQIDQTNYKSCKSVHFPADIEEITDQQFNNHISLQRISFNQSENCNLHTIGNSAFYQCSYLTGTIQFPHSVVRVGSSAFRQCIRLEAIDMSAAINLATIGDYAFGTCFSIQTLILPQTSDLTSYGPYTFDACKKWNTRLVIPPEIVYIGQCAFRSCESIESIDFSLVTELTLGTTAFRYCTMNGTVVLPPSLVFELNIIHSYAFRDCPNISCVNFSRTTLVTIPGSICLGCKQLEIVILPSNVETIQQQAFSECGLLKEVRYASGVTHISETIFLGQPFSSCPVLQWFECHFNSTAATAFDTSQALTAIKFYGKIGTSSQMVTLFSGTGHPQMTIFHVPCGTKLKVPSIRVKEYGCEFTPGYTLVPLRMKTCCLVCTLRLITPFALQSSCK